MARAYNHRTVWCWHDYSVAGSSLQFAASLPPTCRESLAHAALTCGGMTPRYYTAGFAPLQLAWGWLVVGLLCGMLARTCAGGVLRYQQVSSSCPRQSPNARPQADICEPRVPHPPRTHRAGTKHRQPTGQSKAPVRRRCLQARGWPDTNVASVTLVILRLSGRFFRLLLTRANARLRPVTVTPFLLLHNHSERCVAKRGPSSRPLAPKCVVGLRFSSSTAPAATHFCERAGTLTPAIFSTGNAAKRQATP